MSRNANQKTAPARRYVRAVGPRLRILLSIVLGLVALLGANSAYLASITFLEWYQDETYQNYFYQLMFLGHLALGFLLVIPFLIFVTFHIKNASHRPNRRAVKAGYALFGISLLVLISGMALMRIEGFEVRNPELRNVIYWLHVATPFFAIWLYILHRLAGPKLRWKAGLAWATAVGGIVAGMVFFHSQDPRKWNVAGPKEGTKYFEPSLARTASGNFIPAETLMMDAYCRECHADAYEGWFHSAHHFSSFNNEPYLFSITQTRAKLLQRDGNVKASRWCAGCHDVVPFFSGAFDDPNFDMKHHPTANAGITCTACHAITHVNSPRGNADYTIEEPIHYPFVKSRNSILKFINRQLIKAKPAFHKKTFLKPLHKTAAFCSTCHKVSLPGELTHYKEWLRGQNHYDSFLLSGVSGGNAKAFYYPHKAETNCNGCHMPLKESNDFGAKFFEKENLSRKLSIHNHLFHGGNTALPALRGDHEIVKMQKAFLRNALRVDIFGIREGGRIDGELMAPLGSAELSQSVLKSGQTYLIEVVLRTLRLGHFFTQGTADSNEVWLDIEAKAGEQIIGRSGALGEFNAVDSWAHFVNVYMLDRNGKRIDRRNAEDIFTPLYDNQIPPGAAAVLHYRLKVPADFEGSIKLMARLNYRKFDTIYMQHIYGKNFTNDLPITEIAKDQIELFVSKKEESSLTNLPKSLTKSSLSKDSKSKPIADWERWNDYGIGLFLKGEKGQLRQAEEAFVEVEKLGRAEGAINLARVFIKEGRLSEAVDALHRAAAFEPSASRWTLAWLNALVHKQNGFFDEAITQLRSILEDEYEEIRNRGFDFSKDYEVLNELGLTYYAKSTRLRHQPNAYQQTMDLAIEAFEKTLKLDPENETAHHNLSILFSILEKTQLSEKHRRLHERYRVDNNARDRVIAIARKDNPAARHAAQPVVIYDLHRKGAPGL